MRRRRHWTEARVRLSCLQKILRLWLCEQGPTLKKQRPSLIWLHSILHLWVADRAYVCASANVLDLYSLKVRLIIPALHRNPRRHDQAAHFVAYSPALTTCCGIQRFDWRTFVQTKWVHLAAPWESCQLTISRMYLVCIHLMRFSFDHLHLKCRDPLLWLQLSFRSILLRQTDLPRHWANF